MASVSSDTVWSASDTTPDAIEAALRGMLSERHAESDGVAPSRALNMLAFVERAWAGEIANRMRRVGRYHASRLIVISYEPRRERIDARASIASEQRSPGEVSLLHETIVVEIGQRHIDDLLSIADPLVVSDMPTLLWSPHGHPEAVAALLSLAQAVLIDSVDEPDCEEAIEHACHLADHAYVVDLAWMRCAPWRERIAAAFDPPPLRRELSKISVVEIGYHPDSTIVALLLAGWLASRLSWRMPHLLAHDSRLPGTARGRRQDVALRLRADPRAQVRGLTDVTLESASGLSFGFERGVGGMRTRRRGRDGKVREWTILGASRDEGGILGEGIRQALLRDPTYVPALRAAGGMAP